MFGFYRSTGKIYCEGAETLIAGMHKGVILKFLYVEYKEEANASHLRTLNMDRALDSYGESCYKKTEGIVFASRDEHSYGIRNISSAAASAALDVPVSTGPDFDPPRPGIKPVRPVLPRRCSVQSILLQDSHDPGRHIVEWVRYVSNSGEHTNADDAWDEKDDLYRFLKGGLMAK